MLFRSDGIASSTRKSNAQPEVSLACPYCREEISDAQQIECPACQTVHHYDCWQENAGCTVFGCREAPGDEAPISISLSNINFQESLPSPLYYENNSVPQWPDWELQPNPAPAKNGLGRSAFFAITIVLVIVFGIAAEAQSDAVGFLAILISFIPLFFRLRNLGINGWWALLCFIPVLNIGLFLLCLIAPEQYWTKRKKYKFTHGCSSVLLLGILIIAISTMVVISIS